MSEELKQDNKCNSAFVKCNKLEDFPKSKYFIDSLSIIGNKTLSWLKPVTNFTCPLNFSHAKHCNDKKLTNQLIHKIIYEDSLKAGLDAEPFQPEIRYGDKFATWITFNIGNFGEETLHAYALISNTEKTVNKHFLKNYRKTFFENYILKSMNNLLSNTDEADSEFLQDCMTKVKQEISTNGKMLIHKRFWTKFAQTMDDSLKTELPSFTLGFFFGFTLQNVISLGNHEEINFLKVTKNWIAFDDLKKFALIQIHLAITLKCPNQLVVADKTKLDTLSKPSYIEVYRKFCLKKDLVYFTIKKLNNPSFSNFSNTQFYPENWSILMNEIYNSRASFFVNAVFGLTDVGNLNGDILKDYKNLPDLDKHVDNVINWCNKLKSCVGGIETGTIGRIESFFSVTDFNLESNLVKDQEVENANFLERQFHKSQQQFKDVVKHIIMNETIVKSNGFWWTKYIYVIKKWIIEPLIEQVMSKKNTSSNPYIKLRKPLTVAELKRIYDIEQLLLIFIDERRNKSTLIYDSARINKIFRMLKNFQFHSTDSEKNLQSTEISIIDKNNEYYTNKSNNDNLLEEVTDLMSITESDNKNCNRACPQQDVDVFEDNDGIEDLKNPDFILAIAALEASEKARAKWFDKKIVTHRGYYPIVAEYCGFIIECAPENEIQKNQLKNHPVINLMSCYEFCVAKNWEMKTQSYESVFSLEVFERMMKFRRSSKISRLTLDELTITSYAVEKAIKEPLTVLGKTIINRTFDMDDYQILKINDTPELLEFVQDNIKVFPKFLIDPKEVNYHKWCLVEDAPIIRESETKSDDEKIEIDYFRQDKLERYYKKVAYKKRLENMHRNHLK